MLKIINFLILFFVILISFVYYYNETIHINDLRNLTNSYNYAHFSKINFYNFFLFPSFLFMTDPIKFVLNEGESIYIPKDWWHWIITPEKTFAINFWFSDKLKNKTTPFKINDLYNKEKVNEIYNKINEIIEDENDIFIWNSEKNSSLKYSGNTFLKEKRNNRYLITLDGYSYVDNTSIKSKFKKYIQNPDILNSNNSIDNNIWVSTGYHDTGLHFDDNYGILFVLKGKKYVTLYPPNNTKYLLPYDTSPNYVKETPIFMKYNENTIFDNNISGFPSQMLLYQSLKHFSNSQNVFKTIQNIYNCKNKFKKLVWGCKNYNNIYRWEIYNYHYDSHNNKKKIKNDWKKIISDNLFISKKTNNIMNDNNTIINSIDILNNDCCFNNELHTYEKIKKNNELITPFYGKGYDIINEKKIRVSNFIYDTYNNFFENKELFFKELDLPYNSKIDLILRKYKAENICLWNKKGDYFIQWLTISIDDFIDFLIENNYKKTFINYVIKNKSEYKNISHEITVVFDRKNIIPYRSGFYGCL
uniref:JmjC domain-containing protein n=1 Tax=viral metagenome TaxID=1070528 RepID=A0A6C0HTL1_9ZZZZ